MRKALVYAVLGLLAAANSGFVFAKEPLRFREAVLSKGTRIEVSYKVKRSSLTQDYEIIITNNGDVILHQPNNFDKLDGKPTVKNSKLLPEELRDFREFIMESDLFSFDNDYVVSAQTAEVDSQRLKVSINGQVKEIIMSATTLPQGLRAVIERIEEIKAEIK